MTSPENESAPNTPARVTSSDPAVPDRDEPIKRWYVTRLERAVAVEPHERLSLAWSFSWFFCLLSAYYIIRPVRETMATAMEQLEWLFLATFVATVLLSPLYSWLVTRVSRQRLVPIVYRFFSIWLFGFSVAMLSRQTPTMTLVVVFYVWVSVFNLFVVTVFWSVLTDVYTSGQGKRLFGFISAGGSLGGLLASVFVGNFSQHLGDGWILLVPVILLEMAILSARQLEHHLANRDARFDVPPTKERDVIAPGLWTGFISIGRSPYLLGICAFLLIGKWCATTVYMEEIAVVRESVAPAARTSLFAWENLCVQVLTLVFQLFLTQQLIRRLELPATLALLPALLVVGFMATAWSPSLWVLFTLQVLQRTLSYGVVVPAREVLFTVVSKDDNYKSKGLIDTAVYRGGDALSSQLHALLRGIAPHLASAWWMVPAAATWTALGWWIGVVQQRRQRNAAAPRRQLS